MKAISCADAETLLTTSITGIKYPQFVTGKGKESASSNMNPVQYLPIAKRPSEPTDMKKICRHPRVRVVAREEDAEFVECQECGDVFDSSEFRDMAIEENIGTEEKEEA
ncbi:MAG TPA: hypothetical protein VHA33_25305 [Candidatus Angelobacter sp.]|nr:hypothetical protein [Candidatus Angelobacter sp.]